MGLHGNENCVSASGKLTFSPPPPRPQPEIFVIANIVQIRILVCSSLNTKFYIQAIRVRLEIEVAEGLSFFLGGGGGVFFVVNFEPKIEINLNILSFENPKINLIFLDLIF